MLEREYRPRDSHPEIKNCGSQATARVTDTPRAKIRPLPSTHNYGQNKECPHMTMWVPIFLPQPTFFWACGQRDVGRREQDILGTPTLARLCVPPTIEFSPYAADLNPSTRMPDRLRPLPLAWWIDFHRDVGLAGGRIAPDNSGFWCLQHSLRRSIIDAAHLEESVMNIGQALACGQKRSATPIHRSESEQAEISVCHRDTCISLKAPARSGFSYALAFGAGIVAGCVLYKALTAE